MEDKKNKEPATMDTVAEIIPLPPPYFSAKSLHSVTRIFVSWINIVFTEPFVGLVTCSKSQNQSNPLHPFNPVLLLGSKQYRTHKICHGPDLLQAATKDGTGRRKASNFFPFFGTQKWSNIGVIQEGFQPSNNLFPLRARLQCLTESRLQGDRRVRMCLC